VKIIFEKDVDYKIISEKVPVNSEPRISYKVIIVKKKILDEWREDLEIYLAETVFECTDVEILNSGEDEYVKDDFILLFIKLYNAGE
jgi:hypothetical protein